MITLDTLKRDFERIVEEKNPIMLQHRGESELWQNCYYSHPNSTQVKSLQKHVNALKAVQPELHALLTPIVDRLFVKQAEIEVAKAEQAKAREARKNATAAKRKDAAETMANPYRKLHPKVAELMREIAEPYRIKAVEQSKQQQLGFIAEIGEAKAKCGTFNPFTMFPINRKQDDFTNSLNAQKQTQAFQFITRSATADFEMRPNVDEIIEKVANDYAEELVNSFVVKVGTKLSGIVELKKETFNCFITGSLQDHWMTFKFIDGSGFQVQSQIVWKRSINNVEFTQYPTCFRNVTLANGSTMQFPSEAKMKKEFAV